MWNVLATLWLQLCYYATALSAAAADPIAGAGGSIALLTGDVPTDPDTVWGDLVEAAFTGYARVPSDWLVTATDVTGNQSAVAVPALFQNGDATPVAVTGVAMVDLASGDPTNVWMVAALPAPVAIPAGGTLQVAYGFPRGVGVVVL